MAVRWSGRRIDPTPGEWLYPSGEQWSIFAGAHRATVVAVGGGIREYLVNGAPFLAGYAATVSPIAAAGQILAPWPNRIDKGRYRFGGVDYQLPLTEPERGNAIHGLTRWLVWELLERKDDELVVGCDLPPQPGYPWPLRLTTRWTLSTDGLRAMHTATNVGQVSCPFGLGAHPYVWIPPLPLRDLVLQVPAALIRHADSRGIPMSEEPVQGGAYDFLTPRVMGNTFFDHSFTRLLEGADGTTRIRLTTSDGSRGIETWQSTEFSWLQLYSGVGPTGRPGEALAIEPMTCPPNAFATGESLIELAAGQQWEASWGIKPYL